MKLRSKIERLLPWAILVMGLTLFLAQAWPGYTSVDSAVSLGEARSHHYTDWHPPAMAMLWRLVEVFVTGPAGMLVLQGAVFLAGLFLVLRRDFTITKAAVIACVVMLFPPVLAPMSVIWKDCLMAAFLWLGIALLFEERRGYRIAGIVVLALGSAMRHNAPAATLPLLVFGVRFASPWWKQALFAVGIWLAITVTASTANKLLTDEESHTWHAAMGPMDIVGTIKYSKLIPDAELEDILAGTPLVVHEKIARHARKIYTPRNYWGLINGDQRMFDWPQTAEQRAAIERAWKTLVTHHPIAYVYHRYRVFLECLGLSNYPVFDPAWRGHIVSDQKLEPPADDNGFQDAIGRALMWIAVHTFLFRPYIYFAIALLLLPMARRHRDLLALLLAGIGYEVSYFPFAASPDFRYSHFMITCTLIATIVLAVRRLRGRSQPHAERMTGEPAHEHG